MKKRVVIEVEECAECPFATNVTMDTYYIAICRKAGKDLPWNGKQFPQDEFIPDFCPLEDV